MQLTTAMPVYKIQIPAWTTQMSTSRFLAITWSLVTPVDIADFSHIEGWEQHRDIYFGPKQFRTSPEYPTSIVPRLHKSHAWDVIRQIWQMVGRNQHDSPLSMFNRCRPGTEAVIVPWIPISRRSNDRVGSLVTSAPKSFVCDDQSRYKHGIDIYALPRIRETGLRLSAAGAGMGWNDTPRLLTTTSSETALRYSPQRKLHFPSADDGG